MPSINLNFDKNIGPIIEFYVGVSAPRKDALIAAKQDVPELIVARGLIDTGASCTCVDPSLIKKLSIPASGSTSMITPSTGNKPFQCDQYDISFILFEQISYTINSLAVTESQLEHQGFQVLIGRDVLEKCVFHYNGITGQYSLSF